MIDTIAYFLQKLFDLLPDSPVGNLDIPASTIPDAALMTSSTISEPRIISVTMSLSED